MSYKEIVEQVSKELNLSEELVNKVYKSYWEAIKDMIEALPLKDDLNEEEFSQLRTNFNIPSIGKLYCIYDKYKGIKSRYLINKNQNAIYKENKATI